MYRDISKLGHHWLRQWFVASLAPSHYLNHKVLLGKNLVKIESKYNNFHINKMNLKMLSVKWWPCASQHSVSVMWCLMIILLSS